MRKYTRVILVSLLAALGWSAGRAAAQAPGSGAVTPVRGAWTPQVIATSRPVTETQQNPPPAAQQGHPQSPDVGPVARTPAPDAVRLVGEPPQREHPAAPGACLIVERDAPASAAPGKPFVYDIVVRNVGAAEGQRVRVEEQLPTGAAVTATVPQADAHGTLLAWELGSVPPGATVRLRVALVPPADGELSTTAVVTCATLSTLHRRLPRTGLALTIGEPSPAQVGQKVIFPIQLTNYTGAPLSRVVLRVALPAGLQHSQGSQIEAMIPALAPGEVKTVPLELVAAKAGRASLTATATPPGSTPTSAEAAVTVTEAPSAAPAPVPPGVTRAPEVRPTPTPAAPAGTAAPKPAGGPPGAPPLPPPALPDLPP